MAIRAVVFDLFDTLIDLSLHELPRVEIGGRSVPSTAGALHAVASRHADVGFDEFAAVLGEIDRTLRENRHARGLELPTRERFEAVVDRLAIDAPSLAAELTATHMAMIRDRTSVPAHHARVLAELARRVPLGLCSNFSHAAMPLALLGESGLGAHFDALAISETIGVRKPRAEIFEAVLSKLGVEPGDALHVGDSLSADVCGAASLGIKTAWITRRVADPQAALRGYAGPAPDRVIADLAEIAGLLDAL
ncbi:MAG TPA: HAD family hydrolase [Myxococcota bacterium]|nr:HAD family hydrolase [Myxococcota bacterium]